MKEHLKNHFLVYLIVFSVVAFTVFLPNVQITIEGGLAWFVFFLSIMIGCSMVWVCIVGGKISLESNGVRGLIKEIRNRKEREECQ